MPANLGTSGASYKAVTPNDSTDLPDGPCRGLWVGGAGNLSVIGAFDTVEVTLTAVPIGLHALAVKRVRATGTTATLLVAVY